MPRAKSRFNKSAKSVDATPDLTAPEYYFNRELSWLEFNHRVLQEGHDPRTPLLERLRLTGIFCSNLDEFFMLRVAILKQRLESGIHPPTPDGRTITEQLEAIVTRLRPMVTQHHHYFQQTLRPELAAQGIYLLDYDQLQPDQQQYLQQYFIEQLFPVLTPLAIDPSHPFPHISNLSLNLMVVVQDGETRVKRLARVKVPNLLPRLIALPESLWSAQAERTTVWVGVPLEQIIAQHLAALFPGMTVLEHYQFRVTRDAELELEEAPDLLQAIERQLRRRRVGAMTVRLEIAAAMSAQIRAMLLRELELTKQDVYEVDGLMGLRDLSALSDLPLPQLKYPGWTATVPATLRRAVWLGAAPDGEDIFSAIRRHDILLHHPYQSFAASVQLFITQAATDPAVLAIKLTLYRTSADSEILNTLIAAAANGKQVTVLVELQARFDEANNIHWARKLERAGIHVVYGWAGIKTHAKVALVVRRESEAIQRYVHIGTGDYNPKTARRYTDVGLLSCCPALGADLSELFNSLTGYSRQTGYRKLLVAPVNLRQRLMQIIQREIEQAQQGHHARIVAKVGALVDPQIIKTLYMASQAGVHVDVIVQGICCLRPGVAGVSDNIRVISIIGRFLEHSRIFYFHNGGAPETYIGSADWMPRNFDRRVEVLTLIDDPDISKDLQEILGTLLADNRHAWELQPDGGYIQRCPASEAAEINAQKIFLEIMS
jgi:polyphosphate kinase